MSQYPSEGDFLASGTVLRGYEIGSVVGRGGFGVVYKGHHRMLDTHVAIKEYFPRELARRRSGVVQSTESRFEESFQDGLQRFIAEGRRLQAIQDHPNIVSCRDLFLANGTAFMVMDFVNGLSLSALLGQREKNGVPFTEEDLINVISPLLTGLKRAHDSGLYHRDIKPSNILIRRSDNQPVLIDFGAAKQETTGVTKSMAPYTDGYAAMEQVGEGSIGSWTDIYGIGAVMWRMVAGGNPPWEPPNPTKVQQRAYAIIQGVDDSLPSASVIGSGRFSPRLLESIDQCLAISESSRIRSCHELVEKIREPVTEPPHAPTRQGEVQETANQPLLKKRAQRGRPALYNTDVPVDLGNAHSNEGAVSQDYAKASEWHRLAAEKGDVDAQFRLGFKYWNGNGIKQNHLEAVRWFRLAAAQGNAEGQCMLGRVYAGARKVVKRDSAEAVRCRRGFGWPQRKAMPKGSSSWEFRTCRVGAWTRTMWKRSAGFGWPQSKAMPTARITWDMRTRRVGAWTRCGSAPLVSAGRRARQCRRPELLGTCVLEWSGRGPGVEAVRWYRLAAEQGEEGAQAALGDAFRYGSGVDQDYVEAVRWFRLAAAQGDASAQAALGDAYWTGSGVDQDYGEAVRWFRLAAAQGDDHARHLLGVAYRYGRGAEPDSAEAVRWFRLAAAQGEAGAQAALGFAYESGRGVDQDSAEAVRWYRLAAEQGNARAQAALGFAYESGRGVDQDSAEAVPLVSGGRRKR